MIIDPNQNPSELFLSQNFGQVPRASADLAPAVARPCSNSRSCDGGFRGWFKGYGIPICLEPEGRDCSYPTQRVWLKPGGFSASVLSASVERTRWISRPGPGLVHCSCEYTALHKTVTALLSSDTEAPAPTEALALAAHQAWCASAPPVSTLEWESFLDTVTG